MGRGERKRRGEMRLGAKPADGDGSGDGGCGEPHGEQGEAGQQGGERRGEGRRRKDKRWNAIPIKGGGGAFAIAQGAIEGALHFPSVLLGLGEEGEVLRSVVAGKSL